MNTQISVKKYALKAKAPQVFISPEKLDCVHFLERKAMKIMLFSLSG